MQKKIFVFAIVFCMLFSVGCGQENKMDADKIARGELSVFTDEELDTLYETEFKQRQTNMLQEYSMSELEACSGRNIGGILCRETDILMVDTANDCILVLDREGNILSTVGETGNGSLEFLNPTGIAAQNGCIYVLDAENRRIQILNFDLTYKKEICFSENVPKEAESANYIAVDEAGNVYLSSSNFAYGKILCYNVQEETFVELGQNFCGAVSETDGKVYAVNLGVTTGKRNDVSGWRTGLNVLYSLTTEEMTKVCELPYGITPSGFVVDADGIVCASGSYGTVDYYDFSGIYKHSYVNSEDISMYSNLTMDETGTIYVGLPLMEKVLEIKKVE
ncbi:MAG: 6-bladed beta-propeller [Lachnospiraceae bacterium]|nr:6-bladed beta-propeller [Lachnospiraceae bacterium]